MKKLLSSLVTLSSAIVLTACSNSSTSNVSKDVYLLTSEFTAPATWPNDHERVIGVYNAQTGEFNRACSGERNLTDARPIELNIKKNVLIANGDEISFSRTDSEDGNSFRLTSDINPDMVIRAEKISTLIEGKDGFFQHGGTDGNVILCHRGTLENLNMRYESGSFFDYFVADEFDLVKAEKNGYFRTAYKFSGPYDNGLMQLSYIDEDKGVLSTRVFGKELDPDSGEGRDTGWFGKNRRLFTLPSTEIEWSPDNRFGFLKTTGEVQNSYWMIIDNGSELKKSFHRTPEVTGSNCEIQWFANNPVDWSNHETDGRIEVKYSIEENPWASTQDNCGEVSSREGSVSMPLIRPSELEAKILEKKNYKICSLKGQELEKIFAEALFGDADKYKSDKALFANVRNKIRAEIPELARLGCRDHVEDARQLLREFE